MSLLQWFSKKPKATAPKDLESSDLGQVDATVPFSASGREREAQPHPIANGASRKSERLERRELLYTVVRESMTNVGILSANYKFKVLSLDSKGRQYLIMMDLARLYAHETVRLAEIESLIAQSAKARYDILVTALYWRVNEHVTTGTVPLSTAQSEPSVAVSNPAVKPGHEPLLADEMAAFKQALASGGPPKSLASPGEIIRSGGRRNSDLPQFQDTELDDRHAPLSKTQYGDLV